MKNNCTICSLNSIVQVCLTSFSLFKSDNIVLFLFSIEIQDGTYFKKKKQELNSGLKKKITCFKKGISLKKIVQEKLIQILLLKKLGFFFTFSVITLFPLPCLSDSSLAQNHSLMFSEVSPSVSFKALSIKCSLTSWNFLFFLQFVRSQQYGFLMYLLAKIVFCDLNWRRCCKILKWFTIGKVVCCTAVRFHDQANVNHLKHIQETLKELVHGDKYLGQWGSCIPHEIFSHIKFGVQY